MCGIAGLFDPGRVCTDEVLRRHVEEMASALVHRGPDDSGIWVDAEHGVALGYRRLSVVGLGPEGAQPMVSSDGRWVVVYNGELYNHRELRHRLVGEGVAFRGGSDTEVLVATVEHWGLTAALDSWEGMFALALWDRQQHQLHLVRDRFGEKPLYYGWVGPIPGLRLRAEGTAPTPRVRRRHRSRRGGPLPSPQLRSGPPHHLLPAWPSSCPGSWSRWASTPDRVRFLSLGPTGQPGKRWRRLAIAR